MELYHQIPEWIGTAVLGAIIAALGYVGKILIELYRSYRERRRIRRSKLIELQSLLRATKVAFEVQNNHARKLTKWVKENHPEIVKELEGYEDFISRAFSQLNRNEKELHSIIRSITVNTLYPTNKEILEWIKDDDYFKTAKTKKKVFIELASKLSFLESHLILWIAKYEAWIPAYSEHALIYMADEKGHGLGFPTGIEDIVDAAVENY